MVKLINSIRERVHTSILALLHRGTSTTMLNTVFSALAKRGISWNGEMTFPLGLAVKNKENNFENTIFNFDTTNLVLNAYFYFYQI